VGQDVESLFELAQDLNDEEVSFLRDLYDEEIRHTDAGIGRLLGSLRHRGLDDETLVVVVGDHGEEFVEHGGLGHTRTLYDEVLRVPLIIRGPASLRGPRSVDGPVSLVALMPTLLDLMDVDASALRFQAPSFAPLLSGSAPGEPEVLFCEVDFDSWDAHQKGIVVGDSKLIRDDRSGSIELYDLAADPGERSDLAPAVPELVARLVTILDQQARLAREGAGAAQQRAISDEELEQLRALGYGGH
jgi:arylsulfatase A-like enzyme